MNEGYINMSNKELTKSEILQKLKQKKDALTLKLSIRKLILGYDS
jgi:hypothetical protein